MLRPRQKYNFKKLCRTYDIASHTYDIAKSYVPGVVDYFRPSYAAGQVSRMASWLFLEDSVEDYVVHQLNYETIFLIRQSVIYESLIFARQFCWWKSYE